MTNRSSSSDGWTEFARELGHRLRRRRAECNLTQEQVAELAEISLYAYQLYERGTGTDGRPTNPRLATLLAICQVLDIAIEEILPVVPQLARAQD